jgi:hypothetical protein
MKSISFAKLLTLGCFALLLPVACGDDDDDTPTPPDGASGAGGEAPATIPGTGTSSETVECGADACSSTKTLLPSLFIDPCCTAGANTCGVDSGFLTLLGVDLKGACLPKDQPGELDSGCPSSSRASVPFNEQMVGVEGFKGCCRPNNTCGFLVDAVTTDLGVFTSPGLGCVDPSAFGAPSDIPCGGGEGGSGGGGGGGTGGADGLGGMSSEGGAPVVGGGGAGGAGGAP